MVGLPLGDGLGDESNESLGLDFGESLLLKQDRELLQVNGWRWVSPPCPFRSFCEVFRLDRRPKQREKESCRRLTLTQGRRWP